MPSVDDPIITLVGKVELLSYRITELDKKIDGLTTERKEMKEEYVPNTEHNALKTRVEKIESAVWWVIKTIAGIIIAGLMGVIMIKGGA
jgi:hypothetical protein